MKIKEFEEKFKYSPSQMKSKDNGLYGICNPSCEESIQGCGTCETGCQCSDEGCQSNCENNCMKKCQQQCMGVVEMECRDTCQCSREGGCQDVCEWACEGTCEKSCQCYKQGCQECMSSVEFECRNTCQCSREGGCQDVCEWACEDTCEKSCQNCLGSQGSLGGGGMCETHLGGCETCEGSQSPAVLPYKKGQKGEKIKELQRKLNAIGDKINEITKKNSGINCGSDREGHFEEGTKNAVLAFQLRFGSNIWGPYIIGEVNRQVLDAIDKKYNEIPRIGELDPNENGLAKLIGIELPLVEQEIQIFDSPNVKINYKYSLTASSGNGAISLKIGYDEKHELKLLEGKLENVFTNILKDYLKNSILAENIKTSVGYIDGDGGKVNFDYEQTLATLGVGELKIKIGDPRLNPPSIKITIELVRAVGCQVISETIEVELKKDDDFWEKVKEQAKKVAIAVVIVASLVFAVIACVYNPALIPKTIQVFAAFFGVLIGKKKICEYAGQNEPNDLCNNQLQNICTYFEEDTNTCDCLNEDSNGVVR